MKTSDTRRSIRLSDQILRELANIFAKDIQDPRLTRVTLSGVRMNKDLHIAEVLFTLPPAGEHSLAEANTALTKCNSKLRTMLGTRLRLRYLPELRFIHDIFLENMIYGNTHTENNKNI